MAHSARLCENLAAKLLLVVEIVDRLLGEGACPDASNNKPNHAMRFMCRLPFERFLIVRFDASFWRDTTPWRTQREGALRS